MLTPPLPGPHGARLNQLLGALPEVDFDAITTHLERVQLRLGESVYEPGTRLPYALFPTTAVVSLHYVTVTGASTETAGVGHEGMVGLALFLGGESSASSARVQVAGEAYRMPASQLKLAFDGAGALRGLLLRYSQSLMTQIAQISVCNRHHAIEQQFSRWLMSILDRVPSAELVMTQELVAHTLGVRRESITEVAVRLQHAGVIRYRRGHISVLDRSGLEQRACECYGVMTREHSRLMAPAVPVPALAAGR